MCGEQFIHQRLNVVDVADERMIQQRLVNEIFVLFHRRIHREAFIGFDRLHNAPERERDFPDRQRSGSPAINVADHLHDGIVVDPLHRAPVLHAAGELRRCIVPNGFQAVEGDV